jgi:hypothetical protein
MAACFDLTIVEPMPLKWFLVVIGVLLWHIAVSDVARRRATPKAEAFFAGVLGIADLALAAITVSGIAFVLLAILTRQGA